MTPAENEERHLADVTHRLRHALRTLDARLRAYAKDIQEQKTYLWESKADMDRAEKAFTRQTIEQSMMTGEQVRHQRARLQKLLGSPYFGRLDFRQDDRLTAEAIYVGVHHFSDEDTGDALVHDWRAPIATLFYDHETGPAHYDAPSGRVSGALLLKRQFRIRGGRLEFMLESALHIVDDVLQHELSRASDDRMRNIVATIQRDQNAIIRDEHTRVLIIEGVAGSGKTSIALHRIAFLLYRFKDRLTSKDILIISPNRVFADYISNVLPELGEEPVGEIGMEALAEELLGGAFRFQTFVEQTNALLERPDAGFRRRIEVKSSPAFLETLDGYADHVERTCFSPEDVWLGRRLVPAWFLDETFARQRALPATQRLGHVSDAVAQHVGIHYNHDLTADERSTLRAALRRMYRQASLRATYKGLFEWMGEPGLFKLASKAALEYADVFPLIYLKWRLEGLDGERRHVKHLLIDEMQDYTPVQYAVLARLFTCPKTILGDTQQSVSPHGAVTADAIARAFTHASRVKLRTSYRSTREITAFAQRILPDADLVAFERRGEEPQVARCRTAAEEAALVGRLADAFRGSGHRTLGIVCKTQSRATRLHEQLTAEGHASHLLTAQSTSFAHGITVCTAHMAKGLEFDEVVVFEASAASYHTAMDRHLLYIACTRAMHRLTLTHTGDVTPLLAP